MSRSSAERGNAGIADVGHADDRARLRIELAEAVERGRELLRQDRQIALDEAVGDAGGGRGHAGAAGEPGLAGWGGRPVLRFAALPQKQSSDRPAYNLDKPVNAKLSYKV